MSRVAHGGREAFDELSAGQFLRLCRTSHQDLAGCDRLFPWRKRFQLAYCQEESAARRSESVGRPSSGDAEQYCIYRLFEEKNGETSRPAVRLKEYFTQ